jgi:hypothetical protein
MPRHVELRCAACDASIGHVPAARVAIGSPFQECASCGALVSRAPVNEWDFLDPGSRARYGLEHAVRALTAAALPALLYVGFARFTGREVLVWGLVTAALFGVLLAIPFAAHVVASVRRSRRRLADPMYLAKLMAFERENVARARRTHATAEAG